MTLVHASPDWTLLAALLATGLLVARVARWLWASVDIGVDLLP